jgi:hypothetical protein
MSESIGVPFLTFNAWVSAWLLLYTFLCGFFDLTRYILLATRFTDEIFALLIVSIFVLDAIGSPFKEVGLLHYLDPNHKSHEDYEDDEDYSYLATGFLSVILGLGTCSLIFFFRSFKYSAFFCNDGIRTSIHDFALTTSVIVWTLVDQLIFEDVETEGLNVPSQFEPSFACCDTSCTTSFPDDCPDQLAAVGTRPWFVDFTDLNGKTWLPFVAAGPAILAFMLFYFDNGITWHLINHKSHKLQHGEAYNYDIVLNGIFNFINGMLGLPWLVATTVPCIIHLHALAEKDEHGNFIKVQETRLTMLFSHLLLGLSMLALDVLKLLPLPVLYGVFLFMGLSSLGNIQFWSRVMLFFQQPKKYAKTPYTQYMNKGQIHKYTCFQIACFAVVFVVQNNKTIAIVFPLMTLLCIPARYYILPMILEGWELVVLDGDDEQIKEWVDAKDDSVRSFNIEQAMLDAASDSDEEEDPKGDDVVETGAY